MSEQQSGATAVLPRPGEQQVPPGVQPMSIDALAQLMGNPPSSSEQQTQALPQTPQPEAVTQQASPEALANTERLREVLRAETERIGQHMVNVTSFANSEDSLKMLQVLRQMTPLGKQKQEVFKKPVLTVGNPLRLRLTHAETSRGEVNDIVTVTEFTEVRETESGQIELRVNFKKPNYDQNGRLLSEDVGATYVSVQDLIDAQALANADALRGVFPPNTAQGKVLEAYLVVAEQKFLLGDEQADVVLQAVGRDSVRGKEIQEVQQAADTIFSDTNLSEVYKVMSVEARSDGMLIVDDFVAYRKARERQLQTGENGQVQAISVEGKDELDKLDATIQRLHDEGKILLQADDIIDLLKSSNVIKGSEELANSLKMIDAQFNSLWSEYNAASPTEQVKMKEAMEQLQRTKRILTKSQEFTNNPDIAEKQLQGFFEAMALDKVDKEVGIALGKAIRSGQLEEVFDSLSIQAGENNSQLWKKLLELDSNAKSVGKRFLAIGGVIGLLLLVLSSSLSKE